MQEFEEEVLRRDPAMVAKFKKYKASFEEEQGLPLADDFGITSAELKQVKKKVGGVMKFDTGVEVRLLPEFQENALERGYDEPRRMGYLKIFFNSKES
jgi:hypothetical protein